MMAPHDRALTNRLRRLGVRGRHARRAWTRRRTMEVLQTLAWTAPLTLLLWVWAQDQQIEEQAVQNVRVDLRHADPQVAIGLLRATPGVASNSLPVTLTLRGSRSGLDEVLRPLREEGRPMEAVVSPEPAPRLSLDLRPVLAENPLFVEGGVTLAAVSPAAVEVRVEAIAEASAPVVAGGELPASEVTDEPTFDPPRVALRGPQALLRALANLSDGGEVEVAARLPADWPEGGATRPVPVELPPTLRSRAEAALGAGSLDRLRIEPATVEATLTRRARALEERELPTVPIWVDKPAALEGRATVLLPDLAEPVLNNVRVRGPASAIRRLGQAGSRVRARLPLTGDDRNRVGSRFERQIVWDAPPDVEVLTEPPTLTVELVRSE